MNALVLVLAVLSATIKPAAPKIGELITIEFAGPVVLDVSPDYEIVSGQGNRVVVRTFNPKPFSVSGSVAGVRFSGLNVAVASVLAPNDPLTPAPLAPPIAVPYSRAPFVAIAAAVLAALAVWLVVWRRAAREPRPETLGVRQSAEERFRQAVLSLRGNSEHPRRWAMLADETRLFLADTRHLGSELTTTELVPRLGDRDRVAADILRHGDLEKFAPGGKPPADFEAVAEGALALLVPVVAAAVPDDTGDPTP